MGLHKKIDTLQSELARLSSVITETKDLVRLSDLTPDARHYAHIMIAEATVSRHKTRNELSSTMAQIARPHIKIQEVA